MSEGSPASLQPSSAPRPMRSGRSCAPIPDATNATSNSLTYRCTVVNIQVLKASERDVCCSPGHQMFSKGPIYLGKKISNKKKKSYCKIRHIVLTCTHYWSQIFFFIISIHLNENFHYILVDIIINSRRWFPQQKTTKKNPDPGE